MAAEIVLSDNTASGLMKPAGGFKSRAYVTFLARNGDYVKGVVGLAKGLRKVKTAYPLVVAVLPDVPEEHRRLLESQGCILREIEPVHLLENQTQFAMGYRIINYSKLRIWDFEEFSKMIYLNADVQVYDNIDELFDYPDGDLYAVLHCFCKEEMEMMQAKANTALRCQEILYFNSGMFVFEPSKKICKELLDTLIVTLPTPFAEQEYLNKFFEDNYKPLSPVYNLDLAMLWRHPENVVDVKRVKVVHYCAAGSKPWRYTGKEENMQREDVKMLVKKWWEVYNDEALDYKPPTYEEGSLEPVSQQPFQAALWEGGASPQAA
ncbi:galactinol synthase 1 [Cinnamomum micranthum f. kanehirae]|uniref:Hexosyltransferase n=1 Tax=Cinnamomum micranthum f. kanehirae TaxID=337451 RepID=A0A443PUA5_9MAGN|nr:galactinol synthase 1 [Cinnamomum micranthum f. kanehirae]